MKVSLNTDGIKTLSRQLEELAPLRAQVGWFTNTAGRSTDKGRIDDNPTLANQHENGLGGMPERSMLRMPLMQHSQTSIETVDWVTKLQKTGAKRTVASLGIVGEEVVQEAFSMGGYGQWKALRPRTVSRKKSRRILIESAQLRKALGSRVAATP